jgi:Ca2+-binding RTX toxin-like protein
MDTVTASKSAGFTLANASLSSTDGMALGLVGVMTANLAASSNGKTFTISGWTGRGSLADTATGIVAASKSAGFTLTDTSLTATDGMALVLSGIKTANLTATAPSGSPSYVVDASAFSGVTNLVAGGTANTILFGGAANGGTLSATGSGNNVLIGGPGRDTLTDTGAGYNILIGGAGVDTLTGNGNDILISGTTNYDSNASANIAALDAILAEWSSSDTYALRISKTMSGVGPGNSATLNSSTCQSDGKANTVSDGAAPSENNWFIVDSKDVVTKKSNETENIV